MTLSEVRPTVDLCARQLFDTFVTQGTPTGATCPGLPFPEFHFPRSTAKSATPQRVLPPGKSVTLVASYITKRGKGQKDSPWDSGIFRGIY